MGGSEIFTGLETNVINLSDWTSLSQNRAQGFFRVAKFAMFPGFHSCGALDIAVNMRRWNELPPDLQAIVTMATRDFCRDQIQDNELQDYTAAAELPAEGVTLIDLPAEERRKFRELSRTVWADWGKRSPLAQQALASQEKFLKLLNLL
jgi:TRAP-type mannitol/chloroaromatic compound transport system substrate-binding protein